METGELYSLENFQPAKHLKGLLQYLMDVNKLEGFNNYNPSLLGIMSDDVLEKIRAGASSWEEDVPEVVVKAIKFYELFGYKKVESTI